MYLIAVSYTHLDVYKRQARKLLKEVCSSLNFLLLRTFLKFVNKPPVHFLSKKKTLGNRKIVLKLKKSLSFITNNFCLKDIKLIIKAEINLI